MSKAENQKLVTRFCTDTDDVLPYMALVLLYVFVCAVQQRMLLAAISQINSSLSLTWNHILNKYLLDLWQTEWDDYPHNKLYKTFPKFKECVTPRRSNRWEETVLSQLHIGHSYVTHSFLLKGEEPPACIPCDELLAIEHMYVAFLFWFNWHRRAALYCSYIENVIQRCTLGLPFWQSEGSKHLWKTNFLVHFWLNSKFLIVYFNW